MTSHFSIGDIIQGSHRGIDESYHPIIYFGEINSDFFEGGMITHSGRFGNVRLLDVHFKYKPCDDLRLSYFVKNYLIKKQEWGPFTKIGQLSPIGVEFVKSQLDGSTPQIWEDYRS